MNSSGPIKPVKFNGNDLIKPAEFRPLSGARSRALKLRIGAILTVLVSAACLGVIWFIFTAKSVYIQVTPADGLVDIDCGICLKLADRYLMNSGEYRISIEYPRYYPLEQKLVIGDDQNQQYSYELQKLPGHLNLVTRPADGVEVRIDDEYRGRTPIVVRNLTHGSHTLELQTDRYLPYSGSIDIEGMDKEQELRVELIPAWGNVTFSSTPEGAEVFLNDEMIGVTPLTSEILQGEYGIRLKLPGYKAWTDSLKVTANEDMTMPAVTLEEADAVIFIETVPAKANVTVAGKFVGQTPIEVALTPGENVDIRVFKEGYQRAQRRLKVDLNDNRKIRISLKPELTAVKFSSTPPDAELYIDGIFRGRATQVIELTTRQHKVEIKKEGFIAYDTTITPRTGVSQQVNVSLKTIQQARQESIKKIIKTAANQSLKLFYPSGFTMGASRREAGRRANETLRMVNLNKPFYLSLNEVTNSEYREFDKTHSSGEIEGNTLDGDRQPVVNVSWEQAALYCNWLSRKDSLKPFYREQGGRILGANRDSTGYRLPTEAEWAWAARVVSKAQVLKFPWGDVLPPVKGSGNYGDDSAAYLLGRITSGYNDGYVVTAPVGSFKPNSKGLYDLGGNVSEWIHDFYDITVIPPNRAILNPMGPESGDHHVIRGSSWMHGSITELRLSYRDYGIEARDDVGFRIARFLE